MARTVPPAVYTPQSDDDQDPIADLAATTPAYEAPRLYSYAPRAPRPPHRRPHRVLHRTQPVVLAGGPAAAPAPHVAPALILKPPHRLHIIVEPRRVAQQEPEPAVTSPALPDVETAPSAADRQVQLAALERALAADGGAAQMRLSSELAAGRAGDASVTLPAGAVADLESKAEAAGLDPSDGPMTITVTLSGQGYDIGPEAAQTTRIEPGSPAAFRWRITPSPDTNGALSAEIKASASIGGDVRSLPLGTITAELPMLSEAQPPAAAAAPAPPELGQRLRAAIRNLRPSGLSGLRLHDLAIPGRPMLQVPGLGEVPSQDVVAGGLALLLLMFLRSLIRGAGERSQRRRRIEAFESGYYGDGAL
jgi:hypothetical protein